MLNSQWISILVLFISINVFSPISCKAKTIRFELIHRYDPKLPGLNPSSITTLDRIILMIKHDNLRKDMIAQVINHRRQALEMSKNLTFSFPILSGSFSGTGQYFVKFHVGTPAQSFLLVADTGSDLTWMNCRRSCKKCKDSPRRMFLADRSVSFDPIHCSSELCKSLEFSLVRCPTPTSPCAYDYRYVDGSTAQGIFAFESATATFIDGKSSKLRRLIIGCTSSFSGVNFQEADGVLGLGQSPQSFAVRSAAKLSGKFWYCLVDHLSPKNATSYIVFGSGRQRIRLSPPTSYTSLLLNPQTEPFYAIKVDQVTLDGIALPILKDVWDVGRGGGVILDSGTSLTVFAEPAYRVILDSLIQSLKGVHRIDLKPFDFCFNTANGFNESVVPPLVIHFAGGAIFSPPIKSYILEVAKGISCVGLVSGAWPGVSTIGNIMQQQFLWEFDLINSRLGFRRSKCVSSKT